MKYFKPALLIIVLAAIGWVYSSDLTSQLNLETFQAQQDQVANYVEAHHGSSLLAFFVAYVVITALSIPGAALMTMMAGAVFGLLEGLLLASLASTIGATLAMLTARILLRDSIQNRFATQLKTINQGIAREGSLYLFSLRLVPVVPFFVINLVMGLTHMPVRTYFWVSQAGMLAGTAVYVNAGTQLASLESLAGILSLPVLSSFIALAAFPWVAKAIMKTLRRRKLYQPYPKPEQFDEDVVVLGAGAGGLVSAYIAALVKARVTLIEKHQMGGDCLNTGCVPSKALIRSARFMDDIKHAANLGIHTASAELKLSDVMARVHRVIKQIEPHDSIERYSELGVNVVQGEGKITSPYTVEVNGQTIRTRNIIIATGARPTIPPIAGIENITVLTSDTLWQLQELPKRLLVLGGGPIGCELAQSFCRLGSQVTQVEMLPRLMTKEDHDVSSLVQECLTREGVDLRLQHKALEFTESNGQRYLICDHQGERVSLAFDQVLVAVGRTANTTGFGLQELGIETRSNGTVAVNDYLQTRYPNIYAVGDVTGPFQFTHVAAHQAWYAAVNALFGKLKSFKVDYRVIPRATFTEPEVAAVGLNEQQAQEEGVDYELTRYDLADLDRAIADEQASGFVKVLTKPGSDKILGVTIAGESAGDVIAEYVLAMKHGLGLNKILGTIHIYPTLAEMNKFAAGEWKNNRKPETVLKLLEAVFCRLRGERKPSIQTARTYGSLSTKENLISEG